MTSPNPGYFMMTSPSNTIALGLRALMYGFGEGASKDP